MRAAIAIHVKRGKAERVAERVKRIDGVRSATAVFGWADVFVLVDVPNLAGLKRVVDEVSSIRAVTRSETAPELVGT